MLTTVLCIGADKHASGDPVPGQSDGKMVAFEGTVAPVTVHK